MVGEASQPGFLEPGLPGLANGLAPSFVLVVGCHVPDAGMQPDPVVLRAKRIQLGPQQRRFLDGQQVRVLRFEVAEERLDPGLVGRRARPAEVLGDGAGP